MRAVVFTDQCECVVKELPDPQPGLGEVVVRMKSSGICGSDLHLYRGMSAEEAQRRGDRVPGHEPSGVVERVGEGAEKVKPGDRVTVYHYLGCGHCEYCAEGYLQWCRQTRGYGGAIDGAHADLILADERNCVPLPEALTFGDGAFIACAGGTAYSALNKVAPALGDTVAVFGLGPVGLSGVVLAKTMGARVIGVDLIEERLELARKLGAETVIHATEEDVVAAAGRFTDGHGVDGALETSGSAGARRDLVASLGRGGKAAFMGVGSNEDCLNPTALINRQLVLMGSFVLPLWMAWDMVKFMVDQHVSFEPAVTHRFPLEAAPEAYRLADKGRTGKVVFEWE